MFKKLNNSLLYVNGNKLIGICEEVSLPDVKNKMISQKALGHVAEVALPAGLEAMEAKFKLTAPDGKTLAAIANPTKAVQVMLRGNLETWGAEGREEEKPYIAIFRGLFKQVPGGAYKQNENSSFEVMASVNAYKLTVDGVLIYDIDTINNKYIASGEDVIATLKGNIGF
jgi:uncharacterized protein